jgi:hypothetical protein
MAVALQHDVTAIDLVAAQFRGAGGGHAIAARILLAVIDDARRALAI